MNVLKIEISDFESFVGKNVMANITVTVEWWRREGEGIEGRLKVEKEVEWKARGVQLGVRFLFAHAREREWDCTARGGWCTANCSSAEESEAIPLPLVHIAQSLTRCAHCVSIVSPFSLRAAFLLPALELPCVTSAARADAISVSRLAPDQSRTFVSAFGRAMRVERDCNAGSTQFLLTLLIRKIYWRLYRWTLKRKMYTN